MKRIGCPLQARAKKHGSRVAIISAGVSLTYNDFDRLVSKTEQRLKKYNIGPKSRIALSLPNSAEYIILLYALWRIKATACPLNTYLPQKTIKNLLNNINADLFISSSRSMGISFKKFLPDLKITESPKKQYEFSINQNISILFTSGSTGSPKAALHTFGNYYYNALGANKHIPFRQNDRWLLTLPLYHVGGLSIIFRAILGGGSIIIGGKKTISEMNRFLPTHISLVPTTLERLLAQNDAANLKRCKCVLVGGAPLPKKLIHQCISKKIALYGTYGLTEMASQVATSNKITKENDRFSAKILPFASLKVLNGEIMVKGPTLFKGYLQKGKIVRGVDKNGWFKTGDVGIQKGNRIIVLGRADNMFISGGENIHPEEIEKNLLNIKDIQSACVIPKKDREFGSRPIAFIKTARPTRAKRKIIIRQLGKTLPKYKIPDEFYCLPKRLEIGTLKSSRKEIAQYYQAHAQKLSHIN